MSGHKSHLKIQTEAEALVLTPPSTRVMREDLGSACVKMQEISSFISRSLPPDSSSEMVVLSHVGIYWNSKTSISFHQKSQRQRLIFFFVFDAIQLPELICRFSTAADQEPRKLNETASCGAMTALTAPHGGEETSGVLGGTRLTLNKP